MPQTTVARDCLAQRLNPQLTSSAEIEDADLPKPGFDPDPLVHILPELEALYDEGDLARVAVRLSAPVPVATRLLTGDAALLTEDNRNANLGKG